MAEHGDTTSGRISLKVLVRFELLKAYYTRGNRIRLLIGLGAPLLSMLIFWLTGRAARSSTIDLSSFVNGVISLPATALLVSTVSGVYFATSELQDGSAAYALVATNSRYRWISSKLCVAILYGTFITLFSEIEVMFFGSLMFHSLKLHYNFFSFASIEQGFGFAISGLFGSLIGVGVGLLMRKQMVAVTTVIVYTIGVETWLLAVVPKVAKFMIAGGYESISRDPTQLFKLSIPYGYLLLVAWSSLLVYLGILRLVKSDIQWKG